MAQFIYKPYIGQGYTPTPVKGYNNPLMSDDIPNLGAPINANIPANNPYKAIGNYENRFGSVGLPMPEREVAGSHNFLNGLFKVLNMTGSASVNVINDLVDKNPDNIGSLAKSYSQAFTGERQDSFRDVFDTVGWKANDNPDGKWYNPATWDANNVARNVLAFAGDVVTDPLTWVSFGGAAAGKTAVKGALSADLSALALKNTSHIADMAPELGRILGKSTDEILAQVNKAPGSASADDVMRLAYTLGDGSKLVQTSANTKLIDHILDKGFEGINSDMMKNLKDGLVKAEDLILDPQLGKKMSEMSLLKRQRSGTLSQAFGKSIGIPMGKVGGVDFYKALNGTDETLVGKANQVLQDVLQPFSKSSVADFIYKGGLGIDGRKDILNKVYGGEDGIFHSAAGSFTSSADTLALLMSDEEVMILDTLVNAYGTTRGVTKEGLSKQASAIYDIQKKKADAPSRPYSRTDSYSDSTMGRIADATGKETALKQKVVRIQDGIEFSNGLQRVYDKAKSAFYFRYHNPFTNAVAPIVDLTPVVHSALAGKVGGMILKTPVVGAAVNEVRDIAGFILQHNYFGGQGKAFVQGAKVKREYESMVKAGTMTRDEADVLIAKADADLATRADSGKGVADMVTEYKHKETATPYKAIESVIHLFWNGDNLDNAFLKNRKLQSAVTFFREKDLNLTGAITWGLMKGDSMDDILRDVSLTLDPSVLGDMDLDGLAEKMMSNDALMKLVKDHSVSAEELAIIERSSAKMTLHAEEIKKFDETRGSIFNKQKTEAEAMSADFKEPDKMILNPSTYVYRAYKSQDAATGVKNLAQSDVDRLRKKSSTTNTSEMKRQFQSTADAIMAGKSPIHNAIESMALRSMESARVSMNKDMIASLDEAIEFDYAMEALVSRSKGVGKQKMVLGGEEFYAVPEVINQFNRVLESFSDNLGTSKMMGYLDEMTNTMKTLQTKLNPAFNLRNAIGEPLMNWFAGVEVKSWRQAVSVMGSLKKEGFVQVGDAFFLKGQRIMSYAAKDNPESIINKAVAFTHKDRTSFKSVDDAIKQMEKYSSKTAIGMPPISNGRNIILDSKGNAHPTKGNSLNSQEYGESLIKDYGLGHVELNGGQLKMPLISLLEMYRDLGLGWSGVSKGNMIENMQKTVHSELRAQSGNVVANAALNFGDNVETYTRLAHFIDRLDKGYGFEEAAADVRLYHVDYRELTSVEQKVFRRIAPYYTYMRKNFPVQVKNLYTNLNKVNVVSELINSSYGALESQNKGLPLVVDDYLKEGLALPLGMDENGNIQYLNWNLPITDLARIQYNVGDFFDTNVLEMLHPLIKAGFELPANTSLGFGQPIEKFPGQTTPILPNTDTLQVPKEFDYLMQQLGVAESIRKAAGAGYNAATGVQPTALKPGQAPLLQSIMPIKSQMNALNTQAYGYRDQLTQDVQRMAQNGYDLPTLAELTPKPVSRKHSRYTPR